ncbi:hypothetical protein V6N12_013241 [Hibiscus sabdariffa]|uniref:Retrovirus-related Pol polyprotein from transposon TNT 1-94-like beta-barrel domain-containing protein n=1 Tax=Hibiscus sabdariffa TaxID=183260 RepID=A0ABR2D6T8_9ROSI
MSTTTLVRRHMLTYCGRSLKAFMLRSRLLGMGVKSDDEILGFWLLVTLPDSWETFQVSLINSSPQVIITLDLVKSGVLNEEVIRRSQGSTSQSEVLIIKNRGETEKKMKGHIKKYCFKLKRENKGGGDKHDLNDEEKSERADVTREVLLVICDENLVNLACDETSWMVSDGLVSVTSIGDVSLVSNDSTKLILKDVRHAPDIRLNLISAGRLDDEGFCNTFCDGQWTLTKGSLVVARGKKISNLYLMQASTSRDTVIVTMNDSSI